MKGSIALWNIESPTDPRQVFTVTPPAPVLVMGFGPAGLFVTDFDNTIRLVDLSQLALAEQPRT